MPYDSNAIATARRRAREPVPSNPPVGYPLGDWEVLESWSAKPSRRMVRVRCRSCGFEKTCAWENLKVSVTTCRWRPDQANRHRGAPTLR